jgi:hypothetical protein
MIATPALAVEKETARGMQRGLFVLSTEGIATGARQQFQLAALIRE